jgi:hypothetical protein
MEDQKENAAFVSSSEAAGKKKNKIDKETAEAEFTAFCGANDIDYDEDGMTNEDKADFEPIKRRFVTACMRGRVTVDGGKIIYTPSNFTVKEFRDPVEIKRPDGHAFIAMDGYKEEQSIHKLHGFMSAMTGQETKYFSKIDGSDWLFFRDVASLFLSA